MAAELLDKGYGGYCDGAVKESLYFKFKIEDCFRIERHVTAVVPDMQAYERGERKSGPWPI
jgi:hypothetical protein